MLRSANASLVARAASHSGLLSSSTSSTVASASKTTNMTQKAHSLSRSKSTSAVAESPSGLQFRVGSENEARRSADRKQDETHQVVSGEAVTEGSLNSRPRSDTRFPGADELVEARAAKLFMLLAPQVKARSITDRQALLRRSNVGK